MKQAELTIHNQTGLHARPARVFVDTAKRFQSTIKVRHGEKQVNAKSLISVLTLGVKSGMTISVEVDGDDEATALEAIESAVQDGLGEGPATHAAAPSAAPGPAASAANGNGGAQVAPRPATPPAAKAAEPARIVRGTAGAPGVAIGPVYQWTRATIAVDEKSAGAAHERKRIEAALDEARSQLAALHDQMIQRSSAAEAAIFEVHRDILIDPDLLDGVWQRIDAGSSAGVAWRDTIAEQAKIVAALSDALLAERAADIRDVGDRVLRVLAGAESSAPAMPQRPVVLVAYDLTPSETAAFDPARVLGFCTAVGGPNAHTAILARALGLPAVVSAGPSVLKLTDGAEVILDGSRGTLTAEPTADEQSAARQNQEREQAQRAEALRSAAEPAITDDGQRVEIVANIGGLEDARKAAAGGAEGVGLLRTEFLFLERTTAPTEDEHFAVYRDIAEALGEHPVIVRTMDIGGDKPLPYLDLPSEENPFLGERGIRLCLAHPDIFVVQLRAILRAARHGRLRIMFPMVADVIELRAARKLLDGLRAEMDAPPIEVGIMVEVPSAALMADLLAPEVDFFSIGTNDLTQYTLAMDRTHPTLALQADGLHPAVLRLIDTTVRAAHAAGKWVGVCGELGADPQAVPILVGLHVDELSVSVPAIPGVKAQIRSLRRTDCEERARAALACATARDVREGAAVA